MAARWGRAIDGDGAEGGACAKCGGAGSRVHGRGKAAGTGDHQGQGSTGALNKTPGHGMAAGGLDSHRCPSVNPTQLAPYAPSIHQQGPRVNHPCRTCPWCWAAANGKRCSPFTTVGPSSHLFLRRTARPCPTPFPLTTTQALPLPGPRPPHYIFPLDNLCLVSFGVCPLRIARPCPTRSPAPPSRPSPTPTTGRRSPPAPTRCTPTPQPPTNTPTRPSELLHNVSFFRIVWDRSYTGSTVYGGTCVLAMLGVETRTGRCQSCTPAPHLRVTVLAEPTSGPSTPRRQPYVRPHHTSHPDPQNPNLTATPTCGMPTYLATHVRRYAHPTATVSEPRLTPAGSSQPLPTLLAPAQLPTARRVSGSLALPVPAPATLPMPTCPTCRYLTSPTCPTCRCPTCRCPTCRCPISLSRPTFPAPAHFPSPACLTMHPPTQTLPSPSPTNGFCSQTFGAHRPTASTSSCPMRLWRFRRSR